MAGAFHARRGRHVAVPDSFCASAGGFGWQERGIPLPTRGGQYPLPPAWGGARLRQWSFFRTCRWDPLIVARRNLVVLGVLEYPSRLGHLSGGSCEQTL